MPAALRPAFAAAKRVINRVHRGPAYRRPDAKPSWLSSLADRDVLMIDVADLADRCHTGKIYQAHAP